MKPQELIPQCLRRKLEKLDLASNAEARVGILHLLQCQAGLPEQRTQLDSRLFRASTSKSRYAASSAWRGSKSSRIGIVQCCPSQRSASWPQQSTFWPGLARRLVVPSCTNGCLARMHDKERCVEAHQLIATRDEQAEMICHQAFGRADERRPAQGQNCVSDPRTHSPKRD